MLTQKDQPMKKIDSSLRNQPKHWHKPKWLKLGIGPRHGVGAASLGVSFYFESVNVHACFVCRGLHYSCILSILSIRVFLAIHRLFSEHTLNICMRRRTLEIGKHFIFLQNNSALLKVPFRTYLLLLSKF